MEVCDVLHRTCQVGTREELELEEREQGTGRRRGYILGRIIMVVRLVARSVVPGEDTEGWQGWPCFMKPEAVERWDPLDVRGGEE